MIIIDYSQTIISSLMAELNGDTEAKLEVNLIRHMVINAIRSYHKKYSGDFGDLVIACDSRKYWRKEVFPYYKANRKKVRDNSGYDWNIIFDTINILKAELKEFFPYKLVEVEGAEADDIIATLCKETQKTQDPVLIISGDHDFMQLQKYPNVKQYSPVQQKYVKCKNDPKETLLEHIIRGDRGDGVPNVLTGDESIVEGKRQRPIQSKKLALWLADPKEMPQDPTFVTNFERNQTMIDLSRIPEDIESNIINTFKMQSIKDKSMLIDYFNEHKMKNMLELIEEF